MGPPSEASALGGNGTLEGVDLGGAGRGTLIPLGLHREDLGARQAE